MPKYKRYGYIVTRSTGDEGASEHMVVVGFFSNPAKANEYVDMAIHNAKGALEVSEYPLSPQSGMPGERIRAVLIKYPRASTITLCIERWWFEVGRDNG